MSKKIFKNTTILLLIFFMIIQIILPSLVQANYTFPMDAYLTSSHTTPYMIYYKGQRSHASFVTYNYNGVDYPAYCMNDGTPGAETNPYTVHVDGVWNNNAIWRVAFHGYPYTTPASMGLNNADEAFYVTKHAMYCVLGQRNISDYSPMSGYERVYNALVNLVNYGFNGGDVYQSARVDITKEGDLYKDNINGTNYYSQNYRITSPVELASYDVERLNFPYGTKIFNMSNGEQYHFTGEQTIKVSIPETSITSDVNGKVVVQNANCKTYPILYGNTSVPGTQNYCLVGDPYEFAGANISEQFRGNVSSITVNKTDEETNQAINDTEFQLLKDGQVLQTKTTDDNGKVTFSDLYAGNYTVKETRTNDNYVPNNQEQQQSLIYNQNAIV